MCVPKHSGLQELEVTGDKGLWVQTTSHVVHIGGSGGFEAAKFGGAQGTELSIGNIVRVLFFKLAERAFEFLFGRL